MSESDFKLGLMEMETVWYCCAADRSIITIYSDDPVWQKRLASLGVEGTKVGHGPGLEYTMSSKWLRIRKPVPVSEERKAQMRQRLRDYNQKKREERDER